MEIRMTEPHDRDLKLSEADLVPWGDAIAYILFRGYYKFYVWFWTGGYRTLALLLGLGIVLWRQLRGGNEIEASVYR